MKRIIKMAEKPGPTGKFPEGKLIPDDEGELNVGITSYNGNVIMHFGKPVTWIGLPPEAAVKVAQAIIDRAIEARSFKG
jgi:hypothetical protein